MKRFLFAALAALISAMPAAAADLGGQSTADSGYDAPRGTVWSGFYIGARAGYGNANHNLTVQDYFKDFCEDQSDVDDSDFNPFESGERYKTLENLNEGREPTHRRFRTACNTQVGDPVEGGGQNTNTAAPWNTATVSGDSRDVASLDGLSSAGFIGGAQLGYDHQISRRFVVGIFGSYDLADMSTDATLGPIDVNLIEKQDEWSIGARAGLLVNDRTMVYILAAYTQAEWEFIGEENRNSVVFDGITAGAGIEFALTQNIFFGIEGTHTFYGEETVFDSYNADSNQGVRIIDDLGETKVMGTLKVKLNAFD